MNIESMASHLLHGVRGRDVVVGPALWHPVGGAYFIIVTVKSDVHADLVRPGPDGGDICAARDRVIRSIASRRRFMVHVIEDESEMVARCEELWPGPVTAHIRQNFENERAAIRLATRAVH
jgi:hypothetical protein